MANQTENEDVPVLVQRLRRETEELIRMFDDAFLRTCGIAQDYEAVVPAVQRAKKLVDRLWPHRQ